MKSSRLFFLGSKRFPRRPWNATVAREPLHVQGPGSSMQDGELSRWAEPNGAMQVGHRWR